MSGYQFPKDRERFLSVVHNLDTIQAPSSNVLKLLQLCREPNSSTAEIISLIESQPAIAARVIAVANSPLYGYTREIGSINHAVVILGIRNIAQLAVSFGASEVFNSGDGDARIKKALYRHCLACALIARGLAELVPSIDSDEAFLSGILHDIGKLVLLQLIPGVYGELSSQQLADSLQELETETLGINHATIGGICACRWGLPVPIQLAIENHHELCVDDSLKSLSAIVRLADWIVHREGVGSDPIVDLTGFPYDDYSVMNGISEDDIQMVVSEARKQLESLEQAA